jgi:predicted O-methyltransferase YrrM
MKIVHEAINGYLDELTPESSQVLLEMERYAQEHDFPIVGPLVGRFLQQLVILSQPQFIFEMGSGYGYSALWMAPVMPAEGRIHCTEFKMENIERGKKYLDRAGVGDRVMWHEGDAVTAMRRADGPFDIILNDVDKEYYPDSLRAAWPKLRPGGVMITDNVLWSGRVISEQPPARSTAAILEFNRQAYALQGALTTILPLRDGLLLSVKLQQ